MSTFGKVGVGNRLVAGGPCGRPNFRMISIDKFARI